MKATPAELRNIVGQAIYETHLNRAKQSDMRQSRAPAWVDASDAVRKWVLEQADSAITAMAKAGYMVEPGLNDEIPEL